MSVATQRNIGAFVKVLSGSALIPVVAGGGLDDVVQNGTVIDRHVESVSVLLAAKVLVLADIDLASTETATFDIQIEDRVPGGVFALFKALTPLPVVLEADEGNFVFALDVDLGPAKQEVRITIRESSETSFVVCRTLVRFTAQCKVKITSAAT